MNLVITGAFSGLWHYHLSEEGKTTRSLCGAWVVTTSIRLADWKVLFGAHFPKRPTWCAECEKKRDLTTPI